MTAFIVGICMMILPPIIMAGMHIALSRAKKSNEDSDAGTILTVALIVAIILIYFGYWIMDKAVVELGWWTA